VLGMLAAGAQPVDGDGRIPMVLPVQASSVGSSTTWKVEVIVPGPDCQLEVVPGRTGPRRVTPLMSATTPQTVSGSATTSISPLPYTGALRSACTASLLPLANRHRRRAA
jgi:hypothetical protein